MTSTAHALVAGAIASRFSSPFEASSLALCSHYIMDSIPHWDFGTNWRERPKYMTGVIAIADTLIGISVSYMVFGRFLPFGLWAITVIASLLPDWLETPWYIFTHVPININPPTMHHFLRELPITSTNFPTYFTLRHRCRLESSHK